MISRKRPLGEKTNGSATDKEVIVASIFTHHPHVPFMFIRSFMAVFNFATVVVVITRDVVRLFIFLYLSDKDKRDF